MVIKWEFLALDGQPLGGKGADPRNLTRFLPYIRCFYLSSLRDSANEFSPRSQFWGRILRDLKISEEQRKALSGQLKKLNEDFEVCYNPDFVIILEIGKDSSTHYLCDCA